MGCCPYHGFFHKRGFPRWTEKAKKFGGTIAIRATCLRGRSRQHLGPGRSPALEIWNGIVSPGQRRPLLNGETHSYVDILENFPGRNSLGPVGGFHKVIASLTTMFTSERIPELQGTGELPGSNQKSCPIDLPFAFYFPHFFRPWGRGKLLGFSLPQKILLLAGFSVKVKKNLRVISGAVNPKTLVQFLKIRKIILARQNERKRTKHAA